MTAAELLERIAYEVPDDADDALIFLRQLLLGVRELVDSFLLESASPALRWEGDAELLAGTPA